MTITFPLPPAYFSGGAHLDVASTASLAAILNQVHTVAAAGGIVLHSSTPLTATFTSEVGKLYVVNPAGGAFGTTLPAAAVSGDVVAYKNIADSANLFTITSGAGTTVEGYSGFAEVGTTGASTTMGGTANGRAFVQFMLVGTVWRIIAQA